MKDMNEPMQIPDVQKEMENHGIKISTKTLYKYIRSGRLKGVKIGGRYFVTKKSLYEFMGIATE